MLRIILTLLIGAHGIGHTLFLLPLLGLADWGQSARSWLLGGQTEARVIGGLLWIAVIIGYGAALVGLWDEQSWWRSAAVVASVLSMIGLALFWTNPPASSVVFALIFDLLVLGALLLAHWPSAASVGS
mgnify:CR=1 FL=1